MLSMKMSREEGGASSGSNKNQVLDGSDIMELVENKEVFGNFVEHKFEELDTDKDGKLSVKELQPAVADIGVALGLPAQGTSTDSDHIYTEVLNEFTHGKEEQVSKHEFKVALSDILIGIAAGLKRDPIVILRIDGQDLLDFINSAKFETDMVTIFAQVEAPDESLRHVVITKALGLLTVDHGMPPCSDSWVLSNVVVPAVKQCGLVHEQGEPISHERFLEEIKKVLECIAHRLREQPVIVAHTENIFDGSAIKRLLSNKFKLDKSLDEAMKGLPRDKRYKLSKEYLRVALDLVAPAAGLPPYGALDQTDKVVNEVFKMVDADDGKIVSEEEFKKLMTEILGSLMLQLEGSSISVSSNTVVHEPLAFRVFNIGSSINLDRYKD